MHPCLDPETAAVAVQGVLSQSERAVLEQHLLECSGCRRLVADIARLMDADPDPDDASTFADGLARSPAVSPHIHEPASSVGRYSILELLGSGGMGHVYAAYDPQLDRKIAIKTIRSRVSDADEQTSRLLREAQALARVKHENVVTVYDVGIDAGELFIAMEFIDGRDLTSYLRERTSSWRDTVELFVRAGRGLAATHGVGLLHRDFKPANVLVARSGEVLLADFGLAAAGAGLETSDELTAEALISTDSNASNPALASPLTEAGVLVGTIAYMAPERLRGRAATPACDQFSYCVALYEALFGERPFAGVTAKEVAANIRAGEIRQDIEVSRIPAWLRDALFRGLEVDPAHRHPSMDALIRRLVRGLGRKKRRNTRIALGLGLSLIAGAGALFWGAGTSNEVCSGAEERIASVWNEEVQSRLRNAFVGNGLDQSALVYDAVEKNLDAFVLEWTTQYEDACRATHIERIQSPELLGERMACLDAALRGASATLEVLERGGASLVAKADPLTHGLPRSAQCTVERAQRAGPRPPPEKRSEIEEATVVFQRARAEIGAEQMQRGDELAADVLRRAREAGWKPLAVRAHSLLARTRRSERRKHLEAALIGAQADASREMQVWALTELATHLAQKDADFAQASMLTGMAETLAAPPEADEFMQGQVSYARGLIQLAQGEYEEAIGSLQHARTLWTQSFGEGSPRLYGVSAAIATATYHLGDLEGALVGLSQACEVLPPTWLLSQAQCDHKQAIYLNEAGRPSEAIEHGTRALTFYEGLGKSAGSERIQVAFGLNNQGIYHHALRHFRKSEDYYRRAVEEKREVFGESGFQIASSLLGLAELYNDWGRPAEALAAASEAEQLAVAHAPEHPRVAAARAEMGRAALALGDEEQAREQLQSAVEAFDASPDFDLVRQDALARFELARLTEDENPKRARELVRGAIEQLQKSSSTPAVRDLERLSRWLAERRVLDETPG